MYIAVAVAALLDWVVWHRRPDLLSAVGTALIVVAGVLLFMGCFLEALSMMLIMVPVLAPALVPLGVDNIWFGIFFVIMIECALITPPVGLNLYVIQAVGKATLQEVSAGVWPFLVMMLATVVAIYFFPAIALFIPFKL